MGEDRPLSVELGECPFCHGKATVTLKKEPYGYPTGEWSVTYRYGVRPECENGCPIGWLNLPTFHADGGSIDHKPRSMRSEHGSGDGGPTTAPCSADVNHAPIAAASRSSARIRTAISALGAPVASVGCSGMFSS